MFNINEFKEKVKLWVASNPDGDKNKLIDYCEELIPPTQFSANKWLIDQTVQWFQHIKSFKDKQFCISIRTSYLTFSLLGRIRSYRFDLEGPSF